jgi:hypothetical protein
MIVLFVEGLLGRESERERNRDAKRGRKGENGGWEREREREREREKVRARVRACVYACITMICTCACVCLFAHVSNTQNPSPSIGENKGSSGRATITRQLLLSLAGATHTHTYFSAR